MCFLAEAVPGVYRATMPSARGAVAELEPHPTARPSEPSRNGAQEARRRHSERPIAGERGSGASRRLLGRLVRMWWESTN